MKIETPILKRLGPIQFWRGERKCLESLETMYRRGKTAAQAALSNDLHAATAAKPPRPESPLT